MSNVIRWTTPTVTYKLSTVEVTELEKAILTVRMSGTVLYQKDMSEATIDEDANTLAWTFTQAEVGAMTDNKVTVMLNWLSTSGTRGASNRTTLLLEDNDVEEVI